MTLHSPVAPRAGWTVVLRRPMFWAYLLLLVLGLRVFGTGDLYAAGAVPVAAAISVLAQLLLVAVFTTLVRRLDLFEKEPPVLMAMAFLWGGFVATSVAGIANSALLDVAGKVGGATFAEDWGAALAGPLSEEWLKGLGVVAILVLGREHLHRGLDGLVYGAMVGLGFEALENFGYAVNAALTDVNDDVSSALTSSVARLLVGVGAHVVFTGIAGFGIGYLATATDAGWPRRVLVALGSVLAGYGLHALWNSPLLGQFGLWGALAKYALIVLLFTLVYRVSARREFAWFATTVREEDPEVITPEEVGELRTGRSRRRARRQVRRRYGQAAAQAKRRLQDAHLALAIALENSVDHELDPAVDHARHGVRHARQDLTRRGV
ncbi:RsiW-degrading membrane proteinase PrsW (M82 family) [Crossiella equi]|uniref:RsiW-degrading membrane proteinase PrsW (M82 family) n=1 Tax=Crossiella equi TaxID=130796 RepID=A0ABS5AI16_9PSEU|nr:PrsW family intramembrane metalloprotease [Crossiella equi]MBP2476228.1 RsiW-degrading membrane proteinase PrsW (M82 family) [Crossiella equi]